MKAIKTLALALTLGLSSGFIVTGAYADSDEGAAGAVVGVAVGVAAEALGVPAAAGAAAAAATESTTAPPSVDECNGTSNCDEGFPSNSDGN